MSHLVDDLSTLTITIFDGVDLNDRTAVTVKVDELFQAHKATRIDKPDPIHKKAYNSDLHKRLNKLAGEAKQAAKKQQRLLSEQQVGEMRGRIKAKIKAESKAKVDTATVIDVVLDELEAAGVDLSAVRSNDVQSTGTAGSREFVCPRSTSAS